ncbi:hypothetical protein JTB14_024197 [Gonioctena quinquepunctata]|nr:hypothetical protein JTB14_024197 [Gonioctena quinquepunctata]
MSENPNPGPIIRTMWGQKSQQLRGPENNFRGCPFPLPNEKKDGNKEPPLPKGEKGPVTGKKQSPPDTGALKTPKELIIAMDEFKDFKNRRPILLLIR